MNKPKFGVEKEIMLASLLKELETQMSDYNRLCNELDNVMKIGSDNDVVLNVLKCLFHSAIWIENITDFIILITLYEAILPNLKSLFKISL